MPHNERIQTAFYFISQVMGNASLTFEEKMKATADLIPESFKMKEIASAQIKIGLVDFFSKDHKKSGTSFTVTEYLYVGGERKGMLRVFFFIKDQMNISDDFFLTLEEQRFIRTVSKQLSIVVEKEESKKRKGELEAQVRHADRLAKIGQLAAGVAHELNNPLNRILGFAELSLKSPGLPDQTQKDLSKIIGSAKHAREIIKKLMLFSRKMPQNISRIDLNHIVTECVSFLDYSVSQKKIRLKVNTQPDLPGIDGDAFQLNQVVTNMIVNSVQAIGREGDIIITTLTDKANIVLSVHDNGAGIDVDVMDKIFDPFFTTKEWDKGTGLGLSVAENIVKSHGGRIKFWSSPEKGTEFRVFFPVKTNENEKSPENDA